MTKTKFLICPICNMSGDSEVFFSPHKDNEATMIIFKPCRHYILNQKDIKKLLSPVLLLINEHPSETVVFERMHILR